MALVSTGVALAHYLQAYGVTHAFGIPGVHNVELYRGFWQTKIRHISPRHEQGAGFMADGYARASGRPGVAIVITGPGLTNIATAMGQAYGDSSPMLVISSVNKRHELAFGRGYLHEMPNQRNLSAGLTAFSHTLLRPDELPDVVAAAFSVFNSQRPRPVHIEIPVDVGEEKREWALEGIVPLLTSRPAADPAALDRAAALLKGAKRTAIIAGGGAIKAAAELRRLAERLGSVVLLTTNARGLLPPDHPQLAEFAIVYDDARTLLDEADAVLAVGTEIGETDYEFYASGLFRPKTAFVRIDIDPRQIAIGPPADPAIVADAGLALSGLLDRLGKGGKGDTAWCAETVKRFAEIAYRVREPEDPLYDRFLVAIRESLPDTMIMSDSTKSAYRGALTYRATSPRGFHCAATGFGTLGFALPAAVGAKIADPSRPVVALLGDGGIQFTLPELMSAHQAEVGIPVIVWNNDGYGEIRDHMVRKEIKPIAVDVTAPDFLKTAASVGLESRRVQSLDELGAVLKAYGTGAKRPMVIEAGPWLKG